MDSEFTVGCSQFEEQKLTIFQISNRQNAFIFDMDKIGNQAEFQKFFLQLLSNEKIIKVCICLLLR